MRWCVLVVVAGCLQPRSEICGDLVCAPEAQCDQATSTCIPAGCGDGKVNNNEQCDKSDPNDVSDCTSHGFYDPSPVSCTIDCKLDLSMCTQSCGDHTLDGPELCDGEPPPGQSCLDYGYGAGRIACANACTPSFEDCTTVGLRLQHTFPRALHAIAGRARDDGYAVGGAGTIVHYDGHTWSPVAGTLTAGYASLWVDPASKIAVAVGDDGLGHAAVARYDGQTWSELVLPGAEPMNAVWGAGPNDVWAVGGTSKGFAIHYDGATWSAPMIVAPQALNGLAGDAIGHLVAVGKTGATARFDGSTWSAGGTCSNCASPMAMFSFQAVVALSGPTEYIAVGTSPPGEPAVAASSLDGGLTWTTIGPTTTNTTLVGISGTRGDLYVAGSIGVLLRYDGTAFHRVLTGTLTELSAVWRAAADDVQVTLTDGEIRAMETAAWTDTGAIAVSGADQLKLQSVATYRGETLVVTSPAKILSSTNGVSWQDIGGVLPADKSFASVWFAPNGDAYAGMTGGTGATMFFRPANGSFAALANSPALTTSVFGFSPTDVFVTAHNGKVFRGNATTSPWPFSVVGNGTIDLVSGWGSSPGDVYVVGNGLLAHATDGTTWTPIAIPGLVANLTGIWGTGPDDVFAVGGKGTILHFDGTTWRSQHSGIEDLAGVFGIAIADPAHPGTNLRATDVFAFGADAMFHYDGVSWSPMALPTLFAAVSAAAPQTAGRNDVIFVGTRGNAATLARPLAATETRCTDGWDDDRNGLVDCADPACATDEDCIVGGGACRITGSLACGSTIAGTTFTGIGRLDTLPMLTDLTDGPEAVYRFDASAAGMVELTLDTQQALDLVVTQTYAGTAACDLESPVAARSGAGTLSFAAVPGRTYAIIVDSASAAAGSFSLTTACP